MINTVEVYLWGIRIGNCDDHVKNFSFLMNRNDI